MKFTDLSVRRQLTEAKVGRDLQHLEDYLIVDGAEGGMESLAELKKMSQSAGTASVKWDGTMAIYWGNDAQGRFYLVPNAQWSKSLVLDREGLAQEIQNTGRKRPDQSDEQFAANRKSLSDKYMKLWDVFEKASAGTQGFFKGDIMFAEKQSPDRSGNYVFTPNKVTYTVSPKGLYGKMPTAEVFVTVHGKAEELGSSKLVAANPAEIKRLNSTPELIALDIQRPAQSTTVDTNSVDKALSLVKQNAGAINAIANFTAPKFTTLKQILYSYAVKLGKSHDALDFDDWLLTAKVSEPQKVILKQLQAKPEWRVFWSTFLAIKRAKQEIFDQLTQKHGDEMAKTLGVTQSINGRPGGEGYVTAAGKIVNPHFRSAPDNPRFTGEI